MIDDLHEGRPLPSEFPKAGGKKPQVLRDVREEDPLVRAVVGDRDGLVQKGIERGQRRPVKAAVRFIVEKCIQIVQGLGDEKSSRISVRV